MTTKLKQAKNETERRLLLKQIEEVVKERLKYPASDEMDADMKRLKYVRYDNHNNFLNFRNRGFLCEMN